jgi:thiol:disulfide interchange protein DsbD
MPHIAFPLRHFAVVVTLAIAAMGARADIVPPDTEPAKPGASVPAPDARPSITVGEMDHHPDHKAEPAPAPKIVTSCPEIGPAEGDPNAIPADDDLRAKVIGAVARGELMLALLLVLFAGLLTALTPCVYPLIPITLAIFGARQTTPIRGFLLSATYVSGMVALYATLGTGFAAFGLLAGSSLQSPLVTLFVAAICIVMAASMFGAFEIALPGNLQTKLSQMGGTGFRGAFIMGLVAGVIAAPCTGPVLSFILTIIAKDGDVAKGALMMIFYALGIGIPFLILGTFSTAIARMPKSGPWMETVKSIFGVLMLAVGLYYAQFAVPPLATLSELSAKVGLWGSLALFAVGAAIGAFQLSFKYTSTSEQIRKGIGVVFTTAALFSLVGWLMSEPAPAVVEAGEPQHITWTTIAGEDDAVARYDRLLDDAKQACKPVMIDFYADWCAACKELDKFTYVEPSVAEEGQRFATIKIDATTDTDALTEIQKRYGIVGLPTVVFIDSRGQVLENPRVTGFVGAKEYLPIMKRVR